MKYFKAYAVSVIQYDKNLMKAYKYMLMFSLYFIHIILYLFLLLHKMYLSTFIACKIILFYMPKKHNMVPNYKSKKLKTGCCHCV